MSTFYKMDPAAWDFGTSELSLEEEAAYLRVINAIHKHDQPVPDNDRVLAGMFRCSVRKARSLIKSLVEAGKLHIVDGKITNERAISDMVRRQFVSVSRSESGAKGGRSSKNQPDKLLKNKDEHKAIASSRIEENRIESPIPPEGAKRFDEFWNVYPHRNGVKRNRKGAEEKYKSAVRSGVQEQSILDGVQRMKTDPNVIRGYARDPSTWLNQRGWEDEITPQIRAVGGTSSRWGKL